MSSNIQERDTQVGIEMAWHNKTSVEKVISSENCRILYGMEMRPLYFLEGGKPVKTSGRQIISLDDMQAIGRPVGKDYKLISNSEIWDAVRVGLAGTKHEVVSVGTVGDRSLGFISIKVSEDFKAADRETKSMLNILWGHGGIKAVIGRSGFVVVVCGNTYSMALRENSDFKLSIRHTAKASVLDLSEAIDSHIGVAREFQLAMDELHSIDVSATDARKIYAGFVSGNEVPESKTGITRFENTVNELVSLFATGKGNAGRTMADVFNGGTDYYSHASSGKSDPWKQFVSSEFGAGRASKNELFDILATDSSRKAAVKNGEAVLLALGI